MILRTDQESCLYIDATSEKWYIGTPSAPNGALNGALFQKKLSPQVCQAAQAAHCELPLCTTKVWYIYVCTTCTTNVVQVWYTKEGSHVFWIFWVLCA